MEKRVQAWRKFLLRFRKVGGDFLSRTVPLTKLDFIFKTRRQRNSLGTGQGILHPSKEGSEIYVSGKVGVHHFLLT